MMITMTKALIMILIKMTILTINDNSSYNNNVSVNDNSQNSNLINFSDVDDSLVELAPSNLS